MLSSNTITKTLIQADDLRKLERKRIKAFREACYKKDRFWGCEFHCERHFSNDREKKEFEIYKKNMETINRVFSEKSYL